MKVLGQIILHYGSPYLKEAIESIRDQVDHLIILYTSKPSQGYQTDLVCPDTREELMKCVSDKPFIQYGPILSCDGFIQWVDGEWPNEHAHTDAIWEYARGYDWILRMDADEVFQPGFVQEMISQANQTNHKNYCVPFTHFWRSFDWACRDGQMPMRLMRVNGGEGNKYLDSKNWEWFVSHMGYCQPTKFIVYKISVSGHHTEFRPDWLAKKWLANDGTDCHPVMFPGHWEAKPFDKTTLPDILKTSRFFNMEIVEEE